VPGVDQKGVGQEKVEVHEELGRRVEAAVLRGEAKVQDAIVVIVERVEALGESAADGIHELVRDGRKPFPIGPDRLEPARAIDPPERRRSVDHLVSHAEPVLRIETVQALLDPRAEIEAASSTGEREQRARTKEDDENRGG
jgi:hypothetical protein